MKKIIKIMLVSLCGSTLTMQGTVEQVPTVVALPVASLEHRVVAQEKKSAEWSIGWRRYAVYAVAGASAIYVANAYGNSYGDAHKGKELLPDDSSVLKGGIVVLGTCGVTNLVSMINGDLRRKSEWYINASYGDNLAVIAGAVVVLGASYMLTGREKSE